MSNDDVLEQNGQDESSSVDIAELLAAANSKVFDDENGLIDANKNFEKVSSFFDLIKSSNNEDTNLAEQDESPESSAEENSDEEIIGLKISSSDGASDDNEIDEEIIGLKISSSDGASDDNEIDEEIVGLKISSRDGASDDMQTQRGISELEVEKSDTPEEEEISSESFEPLDVIEQSRETVEKLKSQDKAETDQVEETSEEYNLGYQDALNEFEKTLDAEKKAISNFGSTLLSIGDDASKIIEELIKEKLAEISNEFLGKQVSEFPKDFLTHIENISESIVSSTSEIIVELNEIDAAALKTNIKLEQLAFKIKEVTDLGRAEFRIIVGKSGYEQKIAD
ncbi:hypothetical protein OAJ10_00680 [Paracoccaceae bacterium]|nr:hypothetical protein [Paracoccaceae bacterium]